MKIKDNRNNNLILKAGVIGERSGVTIAEILTVYPRQKTIVDKHIQKGELMGIGPFADKGNMAIFKT